MPNRFRIDRQIPAVVTVAWKQPGTGFSVQAVAMFMKFLE
jgi:hypothetical protein